MKRQITDAEKQQVRIQQQDKDGSLKCFISGEIIEYKTQMVGKFFASLPSLQAKRSVTTVCEKTTVYFIKNSENISII